MTAGDSWADLHGTKDRPPKQFFRNWERFKKKKTEDASAGAGPSSAAEGSAPAGESPSSARRGSAVQRLSERLRRGSDTARV